ncbi:MAG: aldo/keto reductase [Saprospiraceae bacterium]
MEKRKLGNTGIEISAIGLGCMGMNHAYGVPDDDESLATLEMALDLGINFWDTADIYANGRNEELVSKVLKPNRKKIFIATKFGFELDKKSFNTSVNGSPAYAKKAVEASLKRLQTDVIDLYYAHRIDPNIPLEEMIGGMADLVKEGKVRFLGLSEASPNSIKRACAVHQIAALQSEYSLVTREVESDVLPLCKSLGIGFIPFSPLGRGLVTNTLDINTLGENDFRKSLPRYQLEFAENNRSLAQALAEIAAQKGCTPSQIALAWVLHQGDHIIPIPGTKRRKYLAENAASISIKLTSEELFQIEIILAKYPNTGARYNEANLKYVDKN